MATLIRGDGRTVNAYQDSIMGDFAFSGKDGIIKDVGQACGLDTTTLNSVKVKSGMVVIQGRQITLDGTDTITLPVATGSTVYWTTLYLELDLSAIADDGKAGKVTLKKLEYTSSYPAVPTSDNLKIQTAGKAYLGLYRFKNTANGVNSVESIAEVIDSGDLSEQMSEAIFDINKDINDINKDINDINTRLDALGFKQGVITVSGAASINYTLKKQGKYALLTIYSGNIAPNTTFFSGEMKDSDGKNINSKYTYTNYIVGINATNGEAVSITVTLQAGRNVVNFSVSSHTYGINIRSCTIGFEIE